MKSNRVLQALTIFLLVITVSYSDAGFVDDWIDQSTTTAPGYFEGQKRGYVTGGSFSARLQTSNDYLFTVTPPKIKSGCGGIDAFMGGFGFLNFDYLVQKFQKILAAAPAAAFDIALKTLCESCANTIKSVEGIANSLNSLQLNDCQAGGALAAYLMSPLAPDNEALQTMTSKMQSDFLINSGLDDLAKKVKDMSASNNDKPAQNTDFTQMIAGCPPEIKAVLGTNGSVLSNISQTLGSSSSYSDLFRGIVGDINVNIQPAQLNISYMPHCDKNRDFTVESLLNGQTQGKDAGGTCYDIPDANRNLRTFVNVKLLSIVNAMKTRGTIDSSDQAFIDGSGMPIWDALRTAVATKSESSVIIPLADLTAKAYALRIMEDLLSKAAFAFDKVTEVASKQPSAKDDQPAHMCKITDMGAVKMLPELQKRIVDVRAAVARSYMSTLTEVNSTMQLVQRFDDVNKKLKSDLSGKFGKAIAERVMR